MYSTCLYCSQDLGANDVLETLPIGRRVAFNEPTGRLWVVCRRCQKWNLVPFDSRLETIDACERLFAGARLKYSTDHIGIARLSEGLELVRIGPAQRHEFAAWRYGDRFGRRARRRMIGFVGGSAVVAVAHVAVGYAGLPLIGVSGAIGYNALRIGGDVVHGLYRRRRVAETVEESTGRLVMTQAQVARAKYRIENDTLCLELQGYDSARAGFALGISSYAILKSDQIIPALARVLPHVNARYGSRTTVRNAVDLLGDDRDMARIIHRTPRTSVGTLMTGWLPERVAKRIWTPGPPRPTRRDGRLYNSMWHAISAIPVSGRLALEMLAHEETERDALAGQLAMLEREWREADRLAKIADDLAISDEAATQFDAARRGKSA